MQHNDDVEAVCRPLQPCTQADEKPAVAPSQQRSKAATKRARKRAAKQQAAASLPNELPVDVAAQPLAATFDEEQLPVISCDSTTAPDATQVGTAAVPPATRSSQGSPCMSTPQVQQSKVGAADAAVQADWARCSLSGKIMRDPVLFGSGGHSFERAALEEWLAANPGVDPLRMELLQSEENSVLPNHALRNLIQQLHLG
jgi:U-box domain